MRSLVLGGSGMLGQALRRELERRGWPLSSPTRDDADITRLESLRTAVRSFDAEIIFNCAAYTDVDGCESQLDRAFAVNGDGVENVATVAAERNLPLLHVSTDYVFAGDADRPYREDHPTAPASVYGKSKRRGESIAIDCPRSLVVRTSWLFGPGGKNFAATMRDRMKGSDQPLRVVDDQIGCPTYTPYLARALGDLAEVGASGMVHYCNHGPLSWYGFALEISSLLGAGVEITPVSSSEFPRPAPRPAYSVLDVERFEEWTSRPVEDWAAGLREFLEIR